MIVTLAIVPSELDSVQNQILSGFNVPSCEVVSEQRLHLVTPHAFGPVSTPSPTKSFVLASHYDVHGGRIGGWMDIIMVFVVAIVIVMVTLELIVV